MNDRIRFVVRGLALAGALLLVSSLASAEAFVETKEKVLPKNGNLVPFTISTGPPGAVIHSITVDNEPTVRRGLCTSNGDGPLINEDEENRTDSGFELVALQIGDGFYRPGNPPSTLGGSDSIAVRPLDDPVSWSEYNMWGIEDNQQMILWFRVETEDTNRVAIEVIVGATGAPISLN